MFLFKSVCISTINQDHLYSRKQTMKLRKAASSLQFCASQFIILHETHEGTACICGPSPRVSPVIWINLSPVSPPWLSVWSPPQSGQSSSRLSASARWSGGWWGRLLPPPTSSSSWASSEASYRHLQHNDKEQHGNSSGVMLIISSAESWFEITGLSWILLLFHKKHLRKWSFVFV